ncbi:MAG TPA: dihydrofolate reductase [Oscillospiraceae bacterium]|nr:dihydrofolate reductase [Oscillospiraceae bacterium]
MRLIVAVNADWGIGFEGDLLVRIPTDLRRFKSMTIGKTVLMGRKTLETMPGGKPLPGRRNLVMTRNRDFSVPGAETLHSVGEALRLAETIPPDDLFIIGGADIYRTFLPYCTRAHVTRFSAPRRADAFFPPLDAMPDWREEGRSEPMEENGIPFVYVDYVRAPK